MNQTLSVEQLAEKLLRIEEEVDTIRKDLAHLRPHTRAVLQAGTGLPPSMSRWADKQEQRRRVNALFATLSIQGAPIGAEALQQSMNQAGLVPNELSRSLVEAREE